MKKLCIICDKEFSVVPSKAPFRQTCSKKCMGISYRKSAVSKKCAWCNEEFRGRPSTMKPHRFCSSSCSSSAIYHEPRGRPMSNIESAYMAGLVDGEGCISSYKTRGYGPYYAVRIAMTDEKTIRWVADIFDASVCKQKQHGLGRKPIYKVAILGANAHQLLKQIRPYMITKRNDPKIDIIMQKYERLTRKQ